METVTTLPRGRPLTVADLEAMPDDGHRYELIDGALVVTPAPGMRHQRASMRLGVLLSLACPPHLEVFAAPFDVVLGQATGVQPDLVVARREDLAERNLPTAPLLVVEILSPSTQLVDLNLKKGLYEGAGVPSYWVVDPVEPRLRAWELREGAYVDVADVAGGVAWTADRPFAVSVEPAALVG